MKTRRSELLIVLLIAAIWITLALLINPRGEFPLNDDWTYSQTVKSLLGGRGLQFPAISTNIIAQIFWGAMFCLPFGFSFTALRISTLTLGLTGVLAFYGLLRETEADRGPALFGALLLACNPLYLLLSYSFMSDVPFVAVAILSLLLFIRGMRRNSRLELAGALLLACAALLIRQTGLAIFMAFGVAYLTKFGWRLRSLVVAALPIALGVTVQLLWDRWMEYKHISPLDHSLQVTWVLSPNSYLSGGAVGLFAHGLIAIAVYVGLFIFPFFLSIGSKRWAKLCRPPVLMLVVLLFAAFAAYWLSFRRMPLMTNVIYDLGLGPPTLRDTFLLGIPSLPSAGRVFWTVVTYVGLVGGTLLCQVLLLAGRKALKLSPFPARKSTALATLLSAGLIYLFPVAMLSGLGRAFDRYLILLVPLGIAIVVLLTGDTGADTPKALPTAVAVASLILMGTFSVAGTHDYLGWNRARWKALNYLMNEQHVSPKEIDGGYEFNGWYLYDPAYKITPGKSYWWVDSDDFMVTFGPVPGFREIRRYPFRRWLPPSRGNILILRRSAPGAWR